MRLVDADAILNTHKAEQEAIGKDWDVDSLATAIMVAKTVETIPVEWLRSKREELLTKNWEIVDSIDNVLQFWVSERSNK